MAGTLYMIPCTIAATPPEEVLPAGNLRIISSLDYFLVENPRTARRFISSLGLGRPVSELEFAVLDEHTRAEEIDALMSPVVGGRSAGVISEAGVPGIADPGAMAVAAAHRHGVRVVPLTGPCSVILSLMASGLNGQSFAFCGYLPPKAEQRARAIRALEKRARTEFQSQIFIEAPYRNARLLEQLLEVCQPHTMLTVAADVTSPEEFIRTLPVSQWRRTRLPDINRRPAIFIIGTQSPQ